MSGKAEKAGTAPKGLDRALVLVAVGSILAVAFGFGLGLPNDMAEQLGSQLLGRVAQVMGWGYFASWSLSFWPQVYTNWKRKSVVGLSLDFQFYNLLGFACYAIFNGAFMFSTTVQREYALKHEGQAHVVELNDLVFSVHAVSVCLITTIQCFIYDKGHQKVSIFCHAFCSSAIIVGTLYWLASWMRYVSICSCFTMLNFLYLLSYVKLVVTLFKYVPQVILNIQRKSTVGWSIVNVLLDISGGLLSLGQVLMVAYVTDDYTAITGNPVRFGLGLVSIVFDIIFMVQHYILYRGHDESEEEVADSVKQPLLQGKVLDDDVEAPILTSSRQPAAAPAQTNVVVEAASPVAGQGHAAQVAAPLPGQHH